MIIIGGCSGKKGSRHVAGQTKCSKQPAIEKSKGLNTLTRSYKPRSSRPSVMTKRRQGRDYERERDSILFVKTKYNLKNYLELHEFFGHFVNTKSVRLGCIVIATVFKSYS